MGSRSIWTYALWFIAASGLVFLWLLKSCLAKEIKLIKSWLWIPLLAFAGLVCLQLVPLPPAILNFISPKTAELYTHFGLPASALKTLSLYPHATYRELIRFAIFVFIFVVIAHSIRKRWQLKFLVLAIITIATFETLYGFAVKFSATDHIFWTKRFTYNMMTGTFRNYNHLCGLLEMAAFIGLGTIVAMLMSAKKQGRLKRLQDFFAHKNLIQILALGTLTFVIFLGIPVSFSRGGLISTSLVLMAFITLLLKSGRLRAGLVTLLLLMIILSATAMYIGIDRVFQRMESAVAGKDFSLAARFDMAKSALPMVNDFPLVGTGWGTFRFVYRMYQPPSLESFYTDYLHNDWLQVITESGFIGAVLLYICILGSFIYIYLRLLRGKEVFYKWMGLGALAGVAAMLIHSLVDFNLYALTANGIIFSVLLGIAFACACLREEKTHSGSWHIPLKSRALRVIAVILTGSIIFWMALSVGKMGWADVQYHHYKKWERGGEDDLYFFLPVTVSTKEAACHALNKALALKPEDAQYHFEKAQWLLNETKENLKNKAREQTIKLTGPALEKENPAKFQRLIARMSLILEYKQSKQLQQDLAQALTAAEDAVDRAPTVDYYRLRQVLLINSLIALKFKQKPVSSDWSKALKDATERAYICAPRHPDCLFVIARRLVYYGQKNEQNIAKIIDYFRQTLYGDKKYSEKVYTLIAKVLKRPDLLVEVTPKFYQNYEILYQFLWQRQDYAACLKILRKMQDLPSTSISWKASEEKAPRRLNIYRRMGAILEIQGIWEQREKIRILYQKELRRQMGLKIKEAQSLIEGGHYIRACSLYHEILAEDWGNVEALLDTARLAMLPELHNYIIKGYTALDYLYQIIIHNQNLIPEQAEELATLAQESVIEPQPLSIFLKGATAVLAQQPQKGVEILQLLLRHEELTPSRHFYHMIFYLMGKGYGQRLQKQKKLMAFQKVRELVPTFKAKPEISPSDSQSHYSQCGVNFGGKIKWWGYILHKAGSPLLGLDDLRNADRIMLQLKEGADPFSRYLFSKLSPAVQTALRKNKSKSKKFLQRLVHELNLLIQQQSMYYGPNCAHIQFREETSDLINQKPEGKEISRLNRLLLEDAYPDCIRKMREITLVWECLSKMGSANLLVVEFMDRYEYLLQRHQPILMQKWLPYPLDLPHYGEFVSVSLPLPPSEETLLLKIYWQINGKKLYTDLGAFHVLTELK